MSDSFTSSGGYIIAEPSVGGISGVGGAEFPILAIRLEVRFRGPREPGCCLDFRELRCKLSAFDSHCLGVGLPVPIKIRLEFGHDLSAHSVYLEIPLDRARLALINRVRNGGDVKLKLALELFADELFDLGQLKGPALSKIWGIRDHHHLHAELLTEVPRSAWLERVLGQTGFEKVHLIELPAISIENCLRLKASHDALLKAQNLEKEGHYSEAVGKCRIALEPFFKLEEKTDEKGKTRLVPALKPEWQTRLGDATYQWLSASLTAIKGPTNKAVHLSSTTFDQVDAQMLLAITTALIAYAAKHGPNTQ